MVPGEQRLPVPIVRRKAQVEARVGALEMPSGEEGVAPSGCVPEMLTPSCGP